MHVAVVLVLRALLVRGGRNEVQLSPGENWAKTNDTHVQIKVRNSDFGIDELDGHRHLEKTPLMLNGGAVSKEQQHHSEGTSSVFDRFADGKEQDYHVKAGSSVFGSSADNKEEHHHAKTVSLVPSAEGKEQPHHAETASSVLERYADSQERLHHANAPSSVLDGYADSKEQQYHANTILPVLGSFADSEAQHHRANSTSSVPSADGREQYNPAKANSSLFGSSADSKEQCSHGKASSSVLDSSANSEGHLNHAKATSVQNSSESKLTANKVVDVLGTSKTLFSFTERLGMEIAKRGFDLVTSSIGGNMDMVRKAFFKAKMSTQKSIYATTAKDQDANVPNQDEKLPPMNPDGKAEITKADKVIVLPGGSALLKQVDMAAEKGKPCMGLLTPNSDTLPNGKPANQRAKDALVTNGFKYVYEEDFQKLLDWLDDKTGAESGAQNILYVSVFGIVGFGLLAMN